MQSLPIRKFKAHPLRWLAGLFGGICLLLAVLILYATGTDLPTKLIFAAIFLAIASLLLRYATGIKARWVLIWAVGWYLAFAGVAELVSLALQLSMAQGWAGKLAGLVVGFLIYLLLPLGVKLINAARRASLSNKEPSIMDGRAPVLYLRSFSSDKRAAHIASRASIASLTFNTHTDEELLAEVLNDSGPCVAIGRPHEWFPPVGFSRLYLGDVSDEVWHAAVQQKMAHAQLIVLMGGASQSFTWEARRAIESIKPEHLLILLPADTQQRTEFLSLLQQLLPAALPSAPKEAVLRSKTFLALVYFTPDWTPHYALPTKLRHFEYPISQKLTMQLKTALRPVYEHLDVPWDPPRIAWSRVAYYGLQAACILLILLAAFGSNQPSP